MYDTAFFLYDIVILAYPIVRMKLRLAYRKKTKAQNYKWNWIEFKRMNLRLCVFMHNCGIYASGLRRCSDTNCRLYCRYGKQSLVPLGRRAYAQNVRLRFLYRQYTQTFYISICMKFVHFRFPQCIDVDDIDIVIRRFRISINSRGQF